MIMRNTNQIGNQISQMFIDRINGGISVEGTKIQSSIEYKVTNGLGFHENNHKWKPTESDEDGYQDHLNAIDIDIILRESNILGCSLKDTPYYINLRYEPELPKNL